MGIVRDIYWVTALARSCIAAIAFPALTIGGVVKICMVRDKDGFALASMLPVTPFTCPSLAIA
ncbi:hypothetical protein NBRC116598_16000 [Pseudophaeobacter arcticus]|jgi:hypothetical protein|uniref:Uncharacterized protein n=1 Tax=Pseudophaeobacter arcticus TaxID=385492 RepID=A0ABQ0AJW8_9RHOB